MRPVNHLLLSSGIGVGVWLGTGEPVALAITIGAGVVVDGDHLPDMVWHHYMHREPTATFVLHGWEWLGGLVLMTVLFGFPWWLIAVIGGYASHLMSDHLFNGARPWTYSIIFRSYHRFRYHRIFPGRKLPDPVTAFLEEIHMKR